MEISDPEPQTVNVEEPIAALVSIEYKILVLVSSLPNDSISTPPINSVQNSLIMEEWLKRCPLIIVEPQRRHLGLDFFSLEVLKSEEAPQLVLLPLETFEDLSVSSITPRFVVVYCPSPLLLCWRTPVVPSPESLLGPTSHEKFFTQKVLLT
ncbi:hypothetical protein Nepgr_013583 [Nepenthes gracilis]|uniref:Uncharacterized protein n=1 Tax=Nepenthes gracilis TaxID=150966 RepID=A0AAD3XNT2_NEPGR|nr:hypothetical protein Nepgr_013583 [Nepenthes gracilis]